MSVGTSHGIRSLQRGTIAIGDGNLTQNATISAVVMLNCDTRGGMLNGSQGNDHQMCVLTAATTVQMSRANSSGATPNDPPYTVIERY